VQSATDLAVIFAPPRTSEGVINCPTASSHLDLSRTDRGPRAHPPTVTPDHPTRTRRCSPPATGQQRGSAILRLPRHRPGPPRPTAPAGLSAEHRLGRRKRVHEHYRRSSRMAQPGGVGDAPSGLSARQRHADRRSPQLGHRKAQTLTRDPGPRRSHAAGSRRRPGPLAAVIGPGTRVHAPGRRADPPAPVTVATAASPRATILVAAGERPAR
jgi:hypothetical protein